MKEFACHPCCVLFVMAFAFSTFCMPVLAERAYQTVPPKLRTKSDQFVSPLEFPKADSESRLWACLVSTDPINRRGVLRLEDRDRLLEFTLHPAAPLFYCGAPASLADFPTGCMVEIWGYGDEATQLPRNILRMSDDFSVKSFSKKAYRIDSIDTDKQKFSATLVDDPRSDGWPYEPSLTSGGRLLIDSPAETQKPIEFSFDGQTRWYIGNRFADANDLAVGQLIKTNFIRKFYDGPPLITRCTDVWLDMNSQDQVTKRQLKSFIAYTRDRGFPLRVDAIDDENKVLTVTLLETGLNDIFKEWKVGQVHDLSAATTTLRMWEPNGGQSVPDRMFGVNITAIEELPIGYGCGGAKLTFNVPMLYEAYRPGTIIKLYPSGHPVSDSSD